MSVNTPGLLTTPLNTGGICELLRTPPGAHSLQSNQDLEKKSIQLKKFCTHNDLSSPNNNHLPRILFMKWPVRLNIQHHALTTTDAVEKKKHELENELGSTNNMHSPQICEIWKITPRVQVGARPEGVFVNVRPPMYTPPVYICHNPPSTTPIDGSIEANEYTLKWGRFMNWNGCLNRSHKT